MSPKSQHKLWDLTRDQRLRYAAAITALWLSAAASFAVPLIAMEAIDGPLTAAVRNATDAAAAPLSSAPGTTAPATTARGPAAPEPRWPPRGWLTPLTVEVRSWFGHAPDEPASLAAALTVAASLIALLTAITGVFMYLRGRWSAVASEAIVRRLRERLHRHLAELPCALHDQRDTGDLVQRCTSDVDTVRLFLATQVVEIGRAVFSLITVLPVMALLNVHLTLVSLALFPPIIVFALIFFRRVKTRFKLVAEAEAELTSTLQENLTGIRVVRAFARQEHEQERFDLRNATYRTRFDHLIRLLAAYWAVSDLLCLAQIGIVLIAGAALVQQGAITVGTLFAFLTLVGMVIWPVRQMGRVLLDAGKAVVALRRLAEILDEPVEEHLDDGTDGTAPADLAGAIDVRGLTFAYGQNEPALRDVSLRVAPGETMALLGRPGSGKSTLVALLLRLYDHEQGELLLDGHDIRALPRRFVRARIGAVLQDPFLYGRTVAANLRVGRADATDELLIESATAAAIHEAVRGFKDGYDTMVGERGVTLSGGQRQRLALARALIKDPPILVLDDALSAVDTMTEAHILRALAARHGTRTTILIAHRLSTVVHADRIVVLDQGVIVQQGTHTELLAQDGVYRRLWHIQGDVEEHIAKDLDTAAPAGSKP